MDDCMWFLICQHTLMLSHDMTMRRSRVLHRRVQRRALKWLARTSLTRETSFISLKLISPSSSKRSLSTSEQDSSWPVYPLENCTRHCHRSIRSGRESELILHSHSDYDSFRFRRGNGQVDRHSRSFVEKSSVCLRWCVITDIVASLVVESTAEYQFNQSLSHVECTSVTSISRRWRRGWDTRPTVEDTYRWESIMKLLRCHTQLLYVFEDKQSSTLHNRPSYRIPNWAFTGETYKCDLRPKNFDDSTILRFLHITTTHAARWPYNNQWHNCRDAYHKLIVKQITDSDSRTHTAVSFGVDDPRRAEKERSPVISRLEISRVRRAKITEFNRNLHRHSQVHIQRQVTLKRDRTLTLAWISEMKWSTTCVLT